MHIREISVQDIKSGLVWRIADDSEQEMKEWEIEPITIARDDDTIVYSALAVLRSGDVRPLLVVREVGTFEWWGDTLEYVDGAWRELEGDGVQWAEAETFVAAPLQNDPSFTGAYSHELQRAGFARWCARLHE